MGSSLEILELGVRASRCLFLRNRILHRSENICNQSVGRCKMGNFTIIHAIYTTAFCLYMGLSRCSRKKRTFYGRYREGVSALAKDQINTNLPLYRKVELADKVPRRMKSILSGHRAYLDSMSRQ